MKHSVRLVVLVLAAAILAMALVGSVSATTVAGPAAGVPGNFTGGGAMRWKGQAGPDVYVGVADLGVGANRVEADAGNPVAAGTYAFTFDYDFANDQMVGTVAPNAVSLAYPFNPLIGGKNPPACPQSKWNALTLLVRDSRTDVGLSLQNVKLDGVTLGTGTFGTTDIAGSPGGQYWTVTGLNLGAGFSLTGDVDIAGASGFIGNEAARVEFVAGCVESLFVSAEKPGITSDFVTYSREDILKWDGANWSLFFDGSFYGLINHPQRHNINAFWVPDESDPTGTVMSFLHNRQQVPGISGWVRGQDLVQFNGADFDLYFDGSDVGLTTAQEKIDGVAVLDGSVSPIYGGCVQYLLINTVGNGWVRNPGAGNPRIYFRGEDVLGFCATNLGDNTAGWWHLAFDGSTYGIKVGWIKSLSAEPDGSMLYFTTKGQTSLPGPVFGGHSMVYAFDTNALTFSGPLFDAPAAGLPSIVDALSIVNGIP